MSRMFLKKQIETFLEQEGISIRELERRSGLMPTSIINILSDRSKNPKASSLVAIAKVIGCSVDELVAEPVFSDEKEVNLPVSNKIEWNVSLLTNVIRAVDKESSHSTLGFEKTLDIVKKIYTLTIKKNETTPNMDFVKWLISEVEQKG